MEVSFFGSEKCRHSAEMFGLLSQEMTLAFKVFIIAARRMIRVMRKTNQHCVKMMMYTKSKHDLITTLKSLPFIIPKIATIYCDAKG